MSIPSGIDTQIPITRYGNESLPQSIILDGTFWSVYLRYNNVFLREYQGQRTGADIIAADAATYFIISNALSGGIISTTKFWLWTVENSNLYFREITPSQTNPPTIGSPILVKTGATTVSAHVIASNIITTLTLDSTSDFGKEVTLNTYPSGGSTPDTTSLINWASTRLNDISLYVKESLLSAKQYYISYVDTSSPPNVYLDELDEIIIGLSGALQSAAPSLVALLTLFTPNLIITLSQNSGSIGDYILIYGNINFDSILKNNIVMFGKITASDVQFVDIKTLRVRVPTAAVSAGVTVTNPEHVSNSVFFDVVYEDIVYPNGKSIPSIFKTGLTLPAIYNRDLSISNFVEIVDENSIVQNVYNIILTRPGERLFNPDFGCDIQNRAFELIDQNNTNNDEVFTIIDDSIKSFEPRAQLIKNQSFIIMNPDGNSVNMLLALLLPSGSVKEVALTIGLHNNSTF